ncbi:hypothetical protein [Levilactobacillus parabrevis]|uniref:hypothetical protein n=1 Tax=Levilactobacillus parabrevis TaxID=357278 RepID=UPI0021A479BA|nr:hypothetical protein [Levilactobacillus parabrevis]MCT4487838.1 hypothetical protein [Levilactobacillus parabrevis]MCT4491300.1 hypothetical protein [Levilactobacillus parabrevis]
MKMNNRKVGMNWLSSISVVSNRDVKVNTAWKILAAEFTFTLATTAIAAHNGKRKKHKGNMMHYEAECKKYIRP